jgi:hypothetical protein
MTDLPTTRFLFELELQLDAKPPRAVLTDMTDGPAAASSNVELGAQPPYGLGMALAPAGPAGTLKPVLSTLAAVPAAPPRPFDPMLIGDDGVLALEWDIRDRELDTEDTTALQIWLSNRSLYYEAGELEITVAVQRSDGTEPGERPDGSRLVSITPSAQGTRRIDPQSTVSFEYFLTTRNTQAGLYTIAIAVHYQLIYVYRELCRQTTAVASVPLRIHGGSAPPLPGSLVPPPSKLDFERLHPQRRLHMSEHAEKDVGYGHRGRELHPIEQHVKLPGGGELCISYRLVKGSHDRPDDSRPSYGINPNTKEIESYFSTSDEAAMEITIRNESNLHLKHVYLCDVHLFHATKDGGQGTPADTDQLPDGNYLFHVLPNDVYFGSLLQGEKRTRYLGLVTRGVKPACFVVGFDTR